MTELSECYFPQTHYYVFTQSINLQTGKPLTELALKWHGSIGPISKLKTQIATTSANHTLLVTEGLCRMSVFLLSSHKYSLRKRAFTGLGHKFWARVGIRVSVEVVGGAKGKGGVGWGGRGRSCGSRRHCVAFLTHKIKLVFTQAF